MSGTYDQQDERLRRQADEQLQARPPLPVWQKRVLERFAVQRRHGWYTLLNQFAPHTPESRPDVVLVGPLGVLVVLLREEEPRPETFRQAFVWTAELLAGMATSRGLLAETAMRTVIVRPIGARTTAQRTVEHQVINERELDRVFLAGEPLLRPADALAAAAHLEGRTFDLTPIAWNPRIPTQRTADAPDAAPESAGLFTQRSLEEQRIDHALDGPFQDWRIFLDDTQLGLVRRHYEGPARITGPAGTGKTVLGLHRLAYLARRTTGQLLFTTHIRNLPRVAREQFASLAPQLIHRVEFTNLHGWARAFLSERGRSAEVSPEEVDAAFQSVWNRLGRTGPLRQTRPARYWRDEIDRVIKGRGIGTLEAYRWVSRKGRGVNLLPGVRAQVWEFYCEYERELTERGVYDHNDVLIRALAELNRAPLGQRYDAVVVDELQDLTMVGLRLVHAISGNEPNQLLLIGDGQQQVYAGGWRLSEAGIALRGRGEILRRNYRNRAAILEATDAVEAVNRFDDLDSGPSVRHRSALPVLGGGRSVRWLGTDQLEAVLSELQALDDTSDVAVLTSTNQASDGWITQLRKAGFDAARLDRWDGRPSAAIQVGTIYRAKGTEFRAVFLPAEPTVVNSAYREEWELSQRRRLVAMTRARDYLWIGELETTGTTPW